MSGRSLLASAVTLLAACAHQPVTPPPSFSAPPPSTYSASIDPSTSAVSIAPPQPMGDALIVRPDRLAMSFVLRTPGESGEAAVDALEREIAAFGEEVRKVSGGRASVRLCGFEADVANGKPAAKADGVVEADLSPDLDYWARARLSLALSELAQKRAGAGRDDDKAASGDEKIVFGVSEQKLLVSDPEKHRPELVRRWIARARSLADTAQSESAPLHFVRCDQPGAIHQQTVSLEEVALSMTVGCQIEVLR